MQFSFESGIRQADAAIVWSVSDTQLATITNGKLVAKKTGTIRLRAALATNPDLYSEKEIEIFSVGKASITIQSNSLKVNDKLELTGKLTDQNGAVLTGINTSWRIDDAQIAEIVNLDGKYYLKGKQVGKCWLYFEVADNPTISDSVQIEVLPESELKKVYISVKTSEKTVIPRKSVWVEQVDLTAKVDRNQKNYGLTEISFVSLAHAIAAGFKAAGFDGDWAFRDDAEGGSALYLWKVPAIEDGSTVYTFGYGGSRTADSYQKTWVVMLNQQPVVSGFDKIKINNDDEILIYHITDNNLAWTVTQLTTGADSVKVGQPVEIQLKKYYCTMDANRNVAINSSEAIANQLVVATHNVDEAKKVSLITDEFGKASFVADQSGEYQIRSGMDSSRLIAKMVTGANPLQQASQQFDIYPNPFTESVKINCSSPIDSVELFTIEGALILVQQGSVTELNLGNLAAGLYVLRVKSGNQVFQQKIVKR